MTDTSQSKSTWKKVVLLITALILIAGIVGITYNWMAGETYIVTEGDAAKVEIGYRSLQRRPDQALMFKLDEKHNGIPGEIFTVSTANALKPLNLEGDCAFKITYSAKGTTRKYLSKIFLEDESKENTDVIEYGSEDSNELLSRVYYGKYTGKSLLDLGELIAQYSTETENSMGKKIEINVEVQFCQLDEDAFKSFFKVPEGEMGKFEPLFI